MASIDLSTALTNLQAAFSSITILITAVSYTLGTAFAVTGLMRYRAIATQTLSSAQKGEIMGPFVYIMIGCILIYFPETLDSSLLSVFDDTTVGTGTDFIAYVGVSADENWRQVSIVVVEYITLVGYIAFIRGWVILSKLGQSGAQPGSMGKGLLHVIGGVLLINIVYSFQILARTFGYS